MTLSKILQDLCTRNFKDFCKFVQDPLSDKILKDVLTWRSSMIYFCKVFTRECLIADSHGHPAQYFMFFPTNRLTVWLIYMFMIGYIVLFYGLHDTEGKIMIRVFCYWSRTESQNGV